MAGLPGTEAKQDFKNIGGCGKIVIIILVVVGGGMAIIFHGQELFEQIGYGVLSLIAILGGLFLVVKILSLFEDK